MKAYKYPLALTVFASLIPVAAQLGHLNYKEITFLTPVVALLLVTVLPSGYRVSDKELLLSYALLVYICYVFALGIGVGSGGVLIVIVLSMVFKRFFSVCFCRSETALQWVVRWVLFIYKFNIVYAYAELVLVLAGYQGVFVSLLATSDQLPGYKAYNHAHFLRAIGFSDVTGLGGLYMGSQAAGMMAVMSVVVFLQLKGHIKNWRRWVVMASGTVVFCSNMTSLLMLIVAAFLMVFVFDSDFKRTRFKVMFIIISPMVIPVVFFKIDNTYELLAYWHSFLPAIEIFVTNLVEFRFFDLMFGYGAVGHSLHEAAEVGIGTDLGMLTLVNQAGLFLFFICVMALLCINYKARNASRLVARITASGSDHQIARHYRFYVTNVIVINMLFVSIFHYTSAIEIGLRELFGMHVGLAMFMGSYWFNRNFYRFEAGVGNGEQK